MALLLLFSGVANSSSAAEIVPLTVPQGPSAKAYLDAVSREWLKTSLIYLPPTAPLDAPIDKPEQSYEWLDTLRGLSWIVLGILATAIVFALWHWRNSFRDLFGRRQGKFAPKAAAGTAAAGAAAADWALVDADFISRLQAERDPRAGLRLILQRFLDLAARDNSISAKRSLTTRELMQRLPGSWQHRAALDVVAQHAELVVFGGREISREAYEECLRLARPFLQRVGPA